MNIRLHSLHQSLLFLIMLLLLIVLLQNIFFKFPFEVLSGLEQLIKDHFRFLDSVLIRNVISHERPEFFDIVLSRLCIYQFAFKEPHVALKVRLSSKRCDFLFVHRVQAFYTAFRVELAALKQRAFFVILVRAVVGEQLDFLLLSSDVPQVLPVKRLVRRAAQSVLVQSLVRLDVDIVKADHRVLPCVDGLLTVRQILHFDGSDVLPILLTFLFVDAFEGIAAVGRPARLERAQGDVLYQGLLNVV
mmetsp:Transcript_30492/g.34919  ORF Transcript_30492/g.34919 Transcript_30492/m.34919 type:complete len:246 (-) Transcript_30492:1266-2003(-)